MLQVLSLQEALSAMKECFSSIKTQIKNCTIENSLGFVLAEDIIAPCNVPDFVRSTVDGYAVNAEETFGASTSFPAEFTIVDAIPMGLIPTTSLNYGEAAYITTGGALPQGSNAVVMVEHTEIIDKKTLLVQKAITPMQHVVQIGDDIAKDALVFPQGTRLQAQDIGVLASLGINQIRTYVPPKVAIIVTGDEIISPEEKLQSGKIYNSNGYFLQAFLHKNHAEVITHCIIHDDEELIYQTALQAKQDADIILITGGSSAGDSDKTSSIINRLGSPGVFIHGIAIKPGKPTIIGKCDEKIVIGLPGNPAATVIIAHSIIKQVLNAIQNSSLQEKFCFAHLTSSYHSNEGREEFVPVMLAEHENKMLASPLPARSHQLLHLAQADGYFIIPAANEGVHKNAMVKVFYFI